MKKLSGTFAFVVLGLIAIVTILSCTIGPSFHHQVSLQFGKDKVEYVEVDKGALDKALRALKSHKGKCYIAFMDDNGKVTEPYLDCNDKDITMDRVTTSPIAQNASARESAVNDPNITYRVQGNSKDVWDVLNAFK
jgi:hypothetical protein